MGGGVGAGATGVGGLTAPTGVGAAGEFIGAGGAGGGFLSGIGAGAGPGVGGGGLSSTVSGILNSRNLIPGLALVNALFNRPKTEQKALGPSELELALAKAGLTRKPPPSRIGGAQGQGLLSDADAARIFALSNRPASTVI